jgi:23S rRNA pseudouridine2605 synthase
MATNGKAGFEKFTVKKNNAAVKEKFKQEKKKAKKDKAKAIEEHFERKRAQREAGSGVTFGPNNELTKTVKPFAANKYPAANNRNTKPNFNKEVKSDKPFKTSNKFPSRNTGTQTENTDKPPFNKSRTFEKPLNKFPNRNTSTQSENTDKPPFNKSKTFEKPLNKFPNRNTSTQTENTNKPPFNKSRTFEKPLNKFPNRNTSTQSENTDKPPFNKSKTFEKPLNKFPNRNTSTQTENTDKPPFNKSRTFEKPLNKFPSRNTLLPVIDKTNADKKTVNKIGAQNEMPLNKFLAHAGISSRREAVGIIKTGKVSVNGTIITEPATKVSEADVVVLNEKKLNPTKNRVYILLNKPKDYITTVSDPEGRKTVIDLVKHATPERVYPVGRLDRNTSGVLLITNDGDLAQHLSHPKNNVKKIYHVTLDKPLTKAHFDEVINGVTLEDGVANVDALAHPDIKFKNEVGIEIHSGKNRIVRRIFESLGYDIKGLDRVFYAGLTKKNVDRGKWRFLSEKEIRNLKFFTKA